MGKNIENGEYGIKYSSSNLSHVRLLCLATLLIISCIAALGVGLGIILTQKIENAQTLGVTTPSSERQKNGQETTTTTATPPYRVSDSIEGHYRYAAIASDASERCPKIGTDILARKGGSAVDAAIATLLCQCAQNCHSCGIGGGHFMTVYNKSTQSAYTIIAREMAPGAATAEMYKPENASSTEGGLAIGIPGEIKGLHLAWTMGGKLPWKDLFADVIKMLEDGWKVTRPLAEAISKKEEPGTADRRVGDGTFGRHPNLKALFTNPRTNKPYLEGEIIRMPKLAETFKKIAEEGPDAFYNGSLSDDIVSDIQEAGGIITREDLLKYKAVVKDPLTIKLKSGSTVFSPPPPSSGAVIEMILNIIDEYGMDESSISTPSKAITTWHRIVEAMKFAYAKRSSLGDSDMEDASFNETLNELLRNMTSEDYAKWVISQIDDQRTFGTMYYGPTFYDTQKTGTSHLSLLAPNGDAVSVTSTINLYFGSKIVGSKTGIIFNDEMDDFSTPNTVNYFGVPASAANFIKPYKRPLSSMCPTIVTTSDGFVSLVVGSSGGTKITTSSAVIAIQTLWLREGIKKSIDQPRLHHQLLPPYIQIENGFDQNIIDGLRDIGHNISMMNSAGSINQGILQLQEGKITANSDYRKYGHTDGF